MRARTYSPHLALFTSRDPLGYVDSYDVWMYVGGNPFALVDPWGTGAELDDPTGGPRGVFREVDPSESELADRHLELLYRDLSIFRGIHYLLWTDAAEERYQRSTAEETRVQPTNPAVGEMMNQIVDATPQASATAWMWFMGNWGTAPGPVTATPVPPRQPYTAPTLTLHGLNGVPPNPSVVNTILTGPRVGSGLKSDAFHRAGSWVGRLQLASGRLFRAPSRDGVSRPMLRTRGEVDGKPGIFEFIIEADGSVSHQLFRPGASVSPPRQPGQ